MKRFKENEEAEDGEDSEEADDDLPGRQAAAGSDFR